MSSTDPGVSEHSECGDTDAHIFAFSVQDLVAAGFQPTLPDLATLLEYHCVDPTIPLSPEVLQFVIAKLKGRKRGRPSITFSTVEYFNVVEAMAAYRETLAREKDKKHPQGLTASRLALEAANRCWAIEPKTLERRIKTLKKYWG